MFSLRKLLFCFTVLAWWMPCPPVVFAADSQAGNAFTFPSTGVSVEGRALFLAIDEYLLPLRENVCCILSTPRYRKEPVVSPETDNPRAPDQVGAHFYGTVLEEKGRFRMWYYGIGLTKPGDARRPVITNLHEGPVCYAESDDGIHWTKPSLGQVDIRGSRANNALLLPDDRIEGTYVIRDDSDPDPQRRYKMFYESVGYIGDHRDPVDCKTAISADGLHWQAGANRGLTLFQEPAGFYKFDGLYVGNGHNDDPRQGPDDGYTGPYSGSGRQGKAFISANFDDWLPGDVAAFLLPEPADPAKRGSLEPYDQVHIGVGAAPFGNVVVGLYGIWHNLPGDRHASFKSKLWFGRGKISCDLGLVISDDGLHFREPVKGRVYISRFDSPATPIAGRDYPTILTQSGNGILNVGAETRIYFGRWLNADNGEGYSADVGLGVLPRDRWGGLSLYPKNIRAYQNHGSVWSAPVRLPASGCRVSLNADHAELMTVEVSDAHFSPLPEFSGAQRGNSDGGGLDCAVVWPAGGLSDLGGRTVRFKVNLTEEAGGDRPRLYALSLHSK